MSENYKLGFRSRKNKLTKIYREKAKEAISIIKNEGNVINIESEEKVFFYDLNDSFELCEATLGKYQFRIVHIISKDSIKISLHDNCNETQDFEYKYTIFPKTAINNIVNNIELISYSQNKKSVTAIWKHLERILKLKFHKDDLVQFFGYYQYPVKHIIKLEVSKENTHDQFWRTLRSISTGLMVGNIISMNELSRTYGISESILFEQLKTLKKLGFEIRNSNTNRQIKGDGILIPYRFPTLNKRSLQRLKEL